MADGFGMEIRAYDPFLAEQGWPEGQAAPVRALADGLAWADVISVNVPKAGRPILGAEELAQVKPGAILVNTARGGIVDEAALVAALADGRVAAAGLDVFDAEPPASDHPLLAFDQVVLSPHVAGAHPAGCRAHGGRFGAERTRLLRGAYRPRLDREQGFLTSANRSSASA